jgi:hypothetical protein
VGTAFPPKRSFIVTPRFATYKVGGGNVLPNERISAKLENRCCTVALGAIFDMGSDE